MSMIRIFDFVFTFEPIRHHSVFNCQSSDGKSVIGNNFFDWRELGKFQNRVESDAYEIRMLKNNNLLRQCTRISQKDVYSNCFQLVSDDISYVFQLVCSKQPVCR